MIKVTRISTHPSIKKHGVGLHSHKISESDFFKTIFIAPRLDENDLHIIPSFGEWDIEELESAFEWNYIRDKLCEI